MASSAEEGFTIFRSSDFDETRKHLGGGAFGNVLLAFHTRWGLNVAIKEFKNIK